MFRPTSNIKKTKPCLPFHIKNCHTPSYKKLLTWTLCNTFSYWTHRQIPLILQSCHHFFPSKNSVTAGPFHNQLHSPPILKIKESLLKSFRSGKIVKLVWMSSHRDIVGNECADSFARSAFTSVVADQKHLIHQHYDLLRLPKENNSHPGSWNGTVPYSKRNSIIMQYSSNIYITPKPCFLFKIVSKPFISTISM